MAINHKENIALIGFVGTTMLSGALLTLPSASADDVVDTITINVPTSCSMSSTIATGNEHTAEINNGQYNSAIGETTIKAFCNDNEGFAIYAIGYTDNELGKNVLTNSTLGSTHDIVTGTAITGNTSNWAMKLSTITSPTPTYPIIIAGSMADTLKQQTDPDFSDFTEVPDDYAKVAYRTSSTDINPEGQQTAEGSTLKTTYQAYISNTQSAGTYTGQVKYTMVHPASEPAPTIPTAIEQAYANAGKEKYNGYYKMQDMSSSICNAVNVYDDETQTQVIDIRDNKVYWIAKLRDGHCWMTQNLDLDLETTPNHVTTLTSENTDLNEYGANGYTSANGYSCSGSEASDCEGGIIAWTPANATTEVTYDSEMKGTFPSISNSSTEYNTPKSLNVGDWYYAGYDGTTLLSSIEVNYLTSTNRTQSNGVTTVNNGSGVDCFSTAPFTGSGTSNNGEHGHVGNYYNWSASVASNDTSGFTTNTHSGGVSGNPANSICPAGWRLPTTTGQSPTYSTEGSKNEFARLVYLYNNNSYVTNSSAKLEAAPLFFARGGNVNGSSLYIAGYYAYYWSSSVYSSSYAYNLNFFAASVYPAGNGSRYAGYSVRCLAQ